jgi:serine/threonine protein kinase
MRFIHPQANVLIDDDGRPRLLGPSLATVTTGAGTRTRPSLEDDAIPWMSPELFLSDCILTKESDCYALGMVIYEVLSGEAPFPQAKFLILSILSGTRPERPQGDEGKLFTDGIWKVVERCWERDPDERPTAEGVLKCLEGDLSPLRSPPDMVGDTKTSPNDQPNDTENRPGIFCPSYFWLSFNPLVLR